MKTQQAKNSLKKTVKLRKNAKNTVAADAKKSSVNAKKNQKAKKIQKQKLEEIEQLEQKEIDDALPKSSFENDIDTSFFYTNDKFINTLDNDVVISEIQKKYPELSSKNADGIIKKHLTYFLEDEEYI